jgi:hypothetical protein
MQLGARSALTSVNRKRPQCTNLRVSATAGRQPERFAFKSEAHDDAGGGHHLARLHCTRIPLLHVAETATELGPLLTPHLSQTSRRQPDDIDPGQRTAAAMSGGSENVR